MFVGWFVTFIQPHNKQTNCIALKFYKYHRQEMNIEERQMLSKYISLKNCTNIIEHNILLLYKYLTGSIYLIQTGECWQTPERQILASILAGVLLPPIKNYSFKNLTFDEYQEGKPKHFEN